MFYIVHSNIFLCLGYQLYLLDRKLSAKRWSLVGHLWYWDWLHDSTMSVCHVASRDLHPMQEHKVFRAVLFRSSNNDNHEQWTWYPSSLGNNIPLKQLVNQRNLFSNIQNVSISNRPKLSQTVPNHPKINSLSWLGKFGTVWDIWLGRFGTVWDICLRQSQASQTVPL